ncbi:unannotated protein [freshwater metagenome]|uniref:Unannotated protein n=1 Tax=freshwater metagenome TaxID=449393 RepID=A0A6J7T5M2_9ZZZZ
MKPGNVAARGLDATSAFFIAEDGSVRVERVVAAAAAGIGLIGLLSRSKKD